MNARSEKVHFLNFNTNFDFLYQFLKHIIKKCYVAIYIIKIIELRKAIKYNLAY